MHLEGQKQWIARFETALWAGMVGRGGEPFDFRAEPCPKHGEACIRLIVAEIVVGHADWAEADPLGQAEGLLNRLRGEHHPPPALPPG